MQIRFRHFSMLVLIILFSLLGVGRAQKIHNSDAYFGYSRLGSDAFYPNVGGLNGWHAAVQVHLHPFLGAEGDVAHYGLGSSAGTPRTTTALVGPRLSLRALGVNLFVHGLVGGEHSSNSDGSISGGTLAYALGGGLDVPIAPFFAWRFSGDRISATTQSPDNGDKFRFNTGLVLRF